MDPLPATRSRGSATTATWATEQAREGAPEAGSGQQALPATSDVPLTSAVAEEAQVADTPSGDDLVCTALKVIADALPVAETWTEWPASSIGEAAQ